MELALSESDQILKTSTGKFAQPHEIIEAKAELKVAPEKSTCLKTRSFFKLRKTIQRWDDIVVLSYGQRGTLTNQLKDGRWEARYFDQDDIGREST